MAQMQICRHCDHVVKTEDEDFVILKDGSTEMHADCYEEELEAEEKTQKAGA